MRVEMVLTFTVETECEDLEEVFDSVGEAINLMVRKGIGIAADDEGREITIVDFDLEDPNEQGR
jgi:GTP cyclohydrolase III